MEEQEFSYMIRNFSIFFFYRSCLLRSDKLKVKILKKNFSQNYLTIRPTINNHIHPLIAKKNLLQ